LITELDNIFIQETDHPGITMSSHEEQRAKQRLEEYINQRTNLIAEERSERFDAQVIANATEKEKRAAEIVSALRAKEAKEIWSASPEKLMYPGMEFLIARETICKSFDYAVPRVCALNTGFIVSTKLFAVVKKVREEPLKGIRSEIDYFQLPKGAILHGHMDAM
jgi:hypothetical protein